nr:flagellar motor control protein ZomB [Millisia brevis]
MITLAAILGTGVLTFWAAWQRRWIADDGLIVLRTVRNLLAGNGPVFNVGERVEANTSTAWTYVVYGGGRLTGIQLEYVVLAIALILTTAAIVIAGLGTALLYRRRAARTGALLLPAGLLVYLALPPARDFATSGLETCLVIFWIAVVWLLLVRWALRGPTVPVPTVETLAFGFWAGLAPLVRPELVIVGGPVLLALWLSCRGWRQVVGLPIIAALTPVGYQIWRMGYYGLPYPNTAVSKDAGGAKWSQGLAYLWNLFGTYALWLPLLVLAIAAVVAVGLRRRSTAAPRAESESTDRLSTAGPTGRSLVDRLDGLRALVQRPAGAVLLMLGTGLLSLVYAVRVGGDFMHGRTLLPGVFLLLLPMAVLPLTSPLRGERAVRIRAATVAVAWVLIVGWSAVVGSMAGMSGGWLVGRSGIVDERAFYTLNTGNSHPILASDYLDYPRMRAMVEAINNTPDGGVLLPAGDFTYWYVVPPPDPIPEGGAEHVVYFLNLGMTSMNVGLDVRVLDQMGLAYPLAAHTERLDNGRIGHDKALFPDWVIADTGMVEEHPWLPQFLDENWIAQAKAALGCQEIQDLLVSYRSELTFARFVQNFKRAFEFAAFRFDRVPKYTLEECGIPLPPPVE